MNVFNDNYSAHRSQLQFSASFLWYCPAAQTSRLLKGEIRERIRALFYYMFPMLFLNQLTGLKVTYSPEFSKESPTEDKKRTAATWAGYLEM